jgi:hypothetical protein
MFVTLFDKNFNALGSTDSFVGTQHTTKSWSLKRKANEFDTFSLVCRGYRSSKDACFVGLFSDEGKMQYLCFSGIPKTQDELTSITGIDCRNIFNQSVYVDLSDTTKIYSEKTLYNFLLSKDGALSGLPVDIDYDIDTDACSTTTWSDQSEYIERTAEIRNIWSLIQAANSLFNLVVLVSYKVDSDTNKYKLRFLVRRISNTISIKLSDYSVKAVSTTNVTNVAIAMVTDTPNTRVIYYLTKDNGIDFKYDESTHVTTVSETDCITTTYDADKMSFPLKIETFAEDDLESAKTKAMTALAGNRFMDKVTIDCNSRLGKKLENVDLTYFGKLVGYNSADGETEEKTGKILPVSSVTEDSSGSRKLEFGRLSDYWFMKN